jgi:hypothetical protein
MQGDRVHLVVLKSSGSFLNLNRVRMGVNQPRLRIRRIAPVVYWGESLFFTLRYTADETRSTAMPRPPVHRPCIREGVVESQAFAIIKMTIVPAKRIGSRRCPVSVTCRGSAKYCFSWGWWEYCLPRAPLEAVRKPSRQEQTQHFIPRSKRPMGCICSSSACPRIVSASTRLR